MSRILIVEDEDVLRADLVDYMRLNGFAAEGVGTAGDMAAALAGQELPDVIILDVTLPDGNGFDLAQRLRSRHNFGIIMLTAHGDTESRVRGFDSGADIYLVKNTSLREIAAAMQSLLRRLASDDGNTGTDTYWTLDATTWKLLTPNGWEIRPTATENTFVCALIEKSGTACSREELSRILSKRQTQFDNRHLDAVVSRLRRKIAEHTIEEQPIRSVYGVGYSFGAAGKFENKRTNLM